MTTQGCFVPETAFSFAHILLISQQYGKGEYEIIQKAIDAGVLLTLIISLIITILGVDFCKSILQIFQVPSEIIDDAVSYFRIILLGTIPSFGYNAVSNFLRGIGDSKTPLLFLLLSSIVNIILDYVFVRYMKWGVDGVAYTTIIVQFIYKTVKRNKDSDQVISTPE